VRPEDLFEVLYEKLKEKLPHLNIDKSSLISKMVLYPISILYSEIFNMINDFDKLLQDNNFINLLYSKLYGIEYEITEITPGEIKLNVGELKDIKIPAGTGIISLNSSNSGIVLNDIYLTKEEIENRIINNMDIIVYFKGNLKSGEEVIFENYEGDIISSFVVREYNPKIIRINNEEIINILSNRPLLNGTFSKEGIRIKINEDIEINDNLTSDNPFVVFDINKSQRYFYVVPVYIDDNNRLVVLDDNVINLKETEGEIPIFQIIL